ncbi:MAG: hypothetical protein V8R82_00955 [Clostridia bacterium]
MFDELGFKAPKFAHIAPIMKNDNGNKRKLSKRRIQRQLLVIMKKEYQKKQ